ncbi:MAG: GAF domain-containing protein, partial [Bacteroidia bacterium]|nr:GAF domain-containing protein [Bacteroidia bacterium]
YCDHDRSQELSAILFEKTRGNPFFTIELLKNLNDRKVIDFNTTRGGWDWDIEKIKNEKYSDNVVDVLLANQSRLKDSTQTVLQLAASIGASFDLQTLSIIHESSMEQTAEDLDEALKANMIIPLSDSYKYAGLTNEEDEEQTKLTVLNDKLIPTYKFQHDRVQQAAYQMISPEKKKSLHLSIGRLMLQHTPEDEIEDYIFDIVSHLNDGRSLLEDDNEKFQLARLNLKAGIKAKQSSAYDAALRYLKIGHELMGEDSWEIDFSLTRKVAEEIQHCYYLTGDRERADFWTEEMLKKSRTDLEKGAVLSARTRQYATIGKMKESIHAAYEGLKILGFELKENPGKEDVNQEIILVSKLLGERSISSLVDEDEMTDKNAQIASHLFMEIFAAAFLSGSGEMFPYLVLKSVNHALKFGNSPESAFAYAAYGMLLCGYLNDPKQGNEFGRLGVDLIGRYDDIALRSRIIYVYTMFTHHWSHHWSSMTPWFKKGIEAGYQSGDLLYLAYSAQDCIIWDPKLDLESSSAEHRKLLAIVKECEYQDSYDSGTLFLQMQMNFQGLTTSKFSMTDETFIEEDCVAGMYDRHFMTGIANYHIYKSEIHLLYNDFTGALDHVLAQENLMASVMSLPQLARFNIVSFMVYSSMIHQNPGADKGNWFNRMKERSGMMAKWAENCKENFEHLHFFMKAELLGHEGKNLEALSIYNDAVEAANNQGFTRDAAMINEFAARCLSRAGFTKAGEGYIKAAHYLYYHWGAYRKVKSLEEEYPYLRSSTTYKEDRKAASTVIDHDTMSSSSFDSNLLDISSLFKASQRLSGELNLEKLLVSTLHILIENAGAQQGCLIEKKEEDIVVKTKITHNGDKDIVEEVGNANDEIKNIPVSLINTSFRTNETIVIDNATKMSPFSSDTYIVEKKPLSIMCIPLPRYGKMQAAVYLENNLTHSAFTEERIEVIKLLASQASISMENARIYEEQEKLLKAQQRFVPIQFLRHLGHNDIAKVSLGESVSVDMSVLFSDIRDFTPLVESLSPPDVIELLNRYYSSLGVPISEYGGFIDSYAGDQIMALFAVPPVQAIRAGVKMSEALWEFNSGSGKTNHRVLSMGIGVNSGPLVLGTMGGKERMQCTVLGDTVNLAARIEQLTKVYHSQFLIGEQSYEAIKETGEFSTRMVDYVAVKGKGMAVKSYEIINAEIDERRALKEATREKLEMGMEAYFSLNFKEALHVFKSASIQDPYDPVFSIFKNRCEKYIENPPPEDWQGFEVLTHK